MTPTELKTAALREIGVLEKTETAPAEEFAIAGDKYEALHAMLLEMNLANWALTEDIPDKYGLPVTWMLANLLTSIFSVPADRKQEMLSLGALGSPTPSLGERQLRALIVRDYIRQPAEIEFF
jgi:hypothetical protein